MLEVDAEEWKILRSQIVTLRFEHGRHRKYLPLAFTEHGAIMAARMGQHCMHLHRYFSLAVFGFIYFWPVAAFGQTNDPPVKKSRQGICHETGSSVYARTTHFEPYGSMEECLKSGGRRSNAASPAAKDEVKSARSQLTPTRTLLAVIVVFVTAGAVAWIWFAGRAKRRDKVQQFEDEARRKWEGHRRE